MTEKTSARNHQDRLEAERELDAAKAIFRSGDESGAVPLFEKLAEAGLAPAMTWVGYVYLKGMGVAVDTATALGWFSKAAEAGDAEAMGWIGRVYFYGYGVPVDFQLAREWYSKGAHAGDADAMSRLGQMHTFGEGGPVDREAARLWYSKAAEAGDAIGQHNYASMLVETGEHEEADRWLRKASEQGHEPSTKSFRERTAHRSLKQKRYAEAIPVLNDLAEAGSAWAREWLGYLYTHGHGVTKNLDQAIVHYEAAYADERPIANQLGAANLKAARPEAALDWFRRDGHTPISSAYWQYRILNDNPHLERHSGEGDELLVKAADEGHVYAQRALAMRMMKGHSGLGTRFQGLRMWVGIFKQALRLIENDADDERLR